ncbi:hypothetical protein VOLCADRAFT_94499 [Volvox carteri f. nagariensis]|uniref:Uncharacterized protein n=1 Tax=Volvox carteri f. nagariensis TaxID=3068 RepID=D8U4Y6_VOLCA|nr:uncharacterized protein VOLCADRAFT_94499 [Volvox carteri f. nagariensis]EFJ45352.1 hypothetical protein VOLCADRAFT_94499 [Volvox carteri f. nagariensis]|eukprot:XP_002953728.1 hypothetical protein VOLCADRAFT_94499 [Volvox carteri f. nagariensis]
MCVQRKVTITQSDQNLQCSTPFIQYKKVSFRVLLIRRPDFNLCCPSPMATSMAASTSAGTHSLTFCWHSWRFCVKPASAPLQQEGFFNVCHIVPLSSVSAS